MLGGCEKDKYDDTALQKRIAELEEQKKRVDELEKQQKNLEAQQKNLESLMAALESNDYITNITPITESGAQVGYTITFTNSPAITLYNGLIASITVNDNVTATFTLIGGKKITVPLYPGDGTEASPRAIFNAADLDVIRRGLYSHYILMADITVTDWLPLGEEIPGAVATKFTDNFDGNGHTITINSFGAVRMEFTGRYHYGLFGYIDGGAVSNLHVAYGNVATVSHNDGSILYGGIASLLDNFGVIENCSVSGAIAIEAPVSYVFAGGITGIVSNFSKIQNCYATGSMPISSGFNNFAGGIVGNIGSFSIMTSCVALQTAITGSAIRSGRVVGIIDSGATVADSYANDEMTVNGATIAAGVGAANNINGADCSSANWSAAAWWTGTLGWSSIWDFTGVSATSYPKLR